MDTYQSIRPYQDSEVASVLFALSRDKDLLDTLANIRFPRTAKLFPLPLRWLSSLWLRLKIRNIDSVDDFHNILYPYVQKLLDTTTDDLTISGLEHLDKDKAYLFISNHRDIVMDSMCLSFLLKTKAYQLPRNAIGSNLMQRDFVGKLLRLNKSFIVERGLSKPRELFVALKRLSSYMRQSITQEKESIWLAQREGRAKDGWDTTDATIIKMLMMGAGKNNTFETNLAELNIIPVAISYEYDPCDQLKAKELSCVELEGSYVKSENEDADSIFIGVKGKKGRVHISIGSPLSELQPLDDIQQVAAALDDEIVANYILYPNNYFAYQMLEGTKVEGVCLASQVAFNEADFAAEKADFLSRVASCPEKYRKYLLQAYANPIKHKIQMGFM